MFPVTLSLTLLAVALILLNTSATTSILQRTGVQSRQIWCRCHTSVDSGDFSQAPPKQSAVCFTCVIPVPVFFSIELPALRRIAATDKLVEKIEKHDSWPIQPDILNPPLLRLTSRKPLWLD